MTFFLHIPYPIAPEHQEIYAGHHREKTGNELSVMPNLAGDECLVKINCNHAPEDILPAGVTPIAVLEIGQARALLQTAEWTEPMP